MGSKTRVREVAEHFWHEQPHSTSTGQVEGEFIDALAPYVARAIRAEVRRVLDSACLYGNCDHDTHGECLRTLRGHVKAFAAEYGEGET